MLAATLGGTVRELKARMGMDEFKRWVAFDRISPLGGRRLDLLAGSIVHAILNSAGKSMKREIPLSECVLEFGPRRLKRKSRREVAAIMGGLVEAAQKKR